MIQPEQIKKYFPPLLRDNASVQKYLIKEYLQLVILDFLTTTQYLRKIAFIGGTHLRLVKGIDRFSEDLDFDCKELMKEEFIEMTEDVLRYLRRYGLRFLFRVSCAIG
jgi:predicted nucleotidyltransferase component of viral defense system